MSASAPFVPTTTPNIERANRLMSLKSNPGFLDLLRISQDLVAEATATSVDYPGWDAQQITVLKCRAQAAKEHHQLLLAKMMDAIEVGIQEARALAPSMPEKTATEIMDQGDHVRQRVLEKFEEYDNRPAGSY